MPWDTRRWDTATLDGYRRLIRLRRAHRALRRGGFRWVHIGDDQLCYLREDRDERLLVAVSRADHPAVTLPAHALGADEGVSLLDGPDLSPAADGTWTLPGDTGPSVRVWSLQD
jgi:alpha-glucosidase